MQDLSLSETGLAWDEYTLNTYIDRFSDVFKAVRKQSSSHNVRWYSFDKGPVHFVVLDSDAWLVPGLYGLGEQQWSWVSTRPHCAFTLAVLSPLPVLSPSLCSVLTKQLFSGK